MPKARTYGAELTGDWRASGGSRRVRGGFLETKMTRTDADSAAFHGREFARSPGLTASGGIDWKPIDPLRVSAQVRHHAGYFSDDLETQAMRIGPATFVDARAAWTVGRMTLFGYVRNILDTFRLQFLSDPRTRADALATAHDRARSVSGWRWSSRRLKGNAEHRIGPDPALAPISGHADAIAQALESRVGAHWRSRRSKQVHRPPPINIIDRHLVLAGPQGSDERSATKQKPVSHVESRVEISERRQDHHGHGGGAPTLRYRFDVGRHCRITRQARMTAQAPKSDIFPWRGVTVEYGVVEKSLKPRRGL